MSFGVESPGADAPMTACGLDLHTATPSVYLDQWVWFRLAKAAAGEPREPTDVAVLEAVRDASAAGVAFPLSTTHYMETSKITDPAHRARLARTMASVSRCRTLRSRRCSFAIRCFTRCIWPSAARRSGPRLPGPWGLASSGHSLASLAR